MAELGEVHPRRTTVAGLMRRFGVQASADAAEVTFTSIAMHSGDVRPGSLFVPVDSERTLQGCQAAVLNGAYGVLVPAGSRHDRLSSCGIPILSVRDLPAKIGPIAAYLNGDPSEAVAVFVACGPHADAVARRLSELLHHLGNPVGLVTQEGVTSLGRPLDAHGRLNAARLQFLESVMAEDGATALVISANPRILSPHALAGTDIDVLFDPSAANAASTVAGPSSAPAAGAAGADASAAARPAPVDPLSHAPVFGSLLTGSSRVVAEPASPADSRLENVAAVLDLSDYCTAVAVRMAIVAGISATAIASAERVAREFDSPDLSGPSDSSLSPSDSSDSSPSPEGSDDSSDAASKEQQA